MRVYKQDTQSTVKFAIHAHDIDIERSKDMLTELTLFVPTLNSNWYNEANVWANEVADTYNLSLEVVAKVTSILSPQTAWEDNQNRAVKVIHAWQVSHKKVSCHTKKNMQKAYNVLNGNDVTFGLKTDNFWKTIVNPSHNKPVIDSIAMSCLLDLYDIPGSYGFSDKNYYKAVKVYNYVANSFNVNVSNLQASIWEYAREKKNNNFNMGIAALDLYNCNGATHVNPYKFAEKLKGL